MLPLLILSLALNAFLLGYARAAIKEAKEYKAAMNESDKTVAILEMMAPLGNELSLVYRPNKIRCWHLYTTKKDLKGVVTNSSLLTAKTITEAVSKLLQATKTTVKFNVALK